MDTQKTCESCGMPMTKPEDFGGGDVNNKYCRYCTYADGTLKTYTDVVAGMTQFIMTRMDIHEAEARAIAEQNLAKMPVWQKQNEN
jgi:hypothetical protein